MRKNGFLDGMTAGFIVGIAFAFMLMLVFIPNANPKNSCEDTFKGDYSKTYDSKTGDAIYHCKGAQ